MTKLPSQVQAMKAQPKQGAAAEMERLHEELRAQQQAGEVQREGLEEALAQRTQEVKCLECQLSMCQRAALTAGVAHSTELKRLRTEAAAA